MHIKVGISCNHGISNLHNDFKKQALINHNIPLTFICNFIIFSLSLSLFLYIYIYIYCHPQTDCFIISQLFSAARHAGHFKLGSKLAQLYIRLNILLLSPQATYVSSGIIMPCVIIFNCLHFDSIHKKSFALGEWQPLIPLLECSTPEKGSVYIYIHMYMLLFSIAFIYVV